MAKGDFVGELELFVLLAVVHLRDAAYGMRIRQEIAARTGRDVAIGAVYATLDRLHAKHWVSFGMSAPEPVQGGRARKVFTLTAAGRAALHHSTTMIGRMMAGAGPLVAGPRHEKKEAGR